MKKINAKVRTLVTENITIPSDITAVLIFTTVADLLFVSLPRSVSVGRAVFGFPLLFFVPGYLLVAVLFPHDHSTTSLRRAGGTSLLPDRLRALELRHRVALSFGMSVTVIPLLGLATATVAGSLSPRNILLALNTFIFMSSVIAVVRRNRLPLGQRFNIPIRSQLRELKRSFVSGAGREQIRIGLLAFSILAAVSMLGFALLSPALGETYTSTTLLTEGPGGNLSASGYPAEMAPGESEQIVLRVENNEQVETTYTVVANLQLMETAGNRTRVTRESTVLTREETVPAGESWLLNHSVSPRTRGEQLRMVYLVYRDETPEDPTTQNAYRTVYFWMSVSAPTEEPQTTTPP